MMVLEIASFVIGTFFGMFLYNFLREDAENRVNLSRRQKVIQCLLSGIFMGCAFLCASRNAQAYICVDSIIILAGLVFLAIFAIQDMIELAVYAFLLKTGEIGVMLLKSMAYIFSCSFAELFSFLFFSAVVYGILKAAERWLPYAVGGGDYEILFIIYILCGGFGTIQVLFAASLIGLVVYVPQLLLKRVSKTDRIPLAPILYLGTLVYFGL